MTEYPWFKHYDAGVPRTLEPYPDKTLFEDVADVAKERPGHRPEGGTVSQLAHPLNIQQRHLFTAGRVYRQERIHRMSQGNRVCGG
jgi:hypothetical protein